MNEQVKRIRDEVETLKQHCENHPYVISFTNVSNMLGSLLGFIDSLPEEEPSRELASFVDKWRDNHFKTDRSVSSGDYLFRSSQIDLAHCVAEWQKEQYEKDISEALRMEYEKGRHDMREEMMKDAVEGKAIRFSTQEFVSFMGFVLSSRLDSKMLDGIKLGDKVKLIVIKEDKQ